MPVTDMNTWGPLVWEDGTVLGSFACPECDNDVAETLVWIDKGLVRFVSVEPQLEPVRLDLAGVAWVICGGESGAERRPFDVAWARDLRAQCERAGVAFFYKQGSSYSQGQDCALDGAEVKEWPGGPAPDLLGALAMA